MKTEDQLLLICLRQNFMPEHAQAVCEMAIRNPLDWERIALTAEQNGIPSLIYRNLCICQNWGLNIPENAVQKLKLSTYKNALVKEDQKKRMIRALSYFHERNLEIMLIKGAALDRCVYKNPDYVLYDDIDIIIHVKRDDLTDEQIKEINIYFHKQGVEFDFFSHHDININGLLPIDFSGIWARAGQVNYLGFPVFLMSKEDLLISLCINSSRKRYFRIKSILDIHEAVHAMQDISWKEVSERAKEFECENIIYTALLVTDQSIGGDLPKGWEDIFTINPIRRKVIDTTTTYLLDHISFYPYPHSGISITGRTLYLSLILPYIGYTRTQTINKLSYVVHVHGN